MICAVIPTRYHPPELFRLLAVLWQDGICTHLTVDAHKSDHRIYRMWNVACDAARGHGAKYIAVLNDDIEIMPGTVPLLARVFEHDERLGVAYPDFYSRWGSLPRKPIVTSTTGMWPWPEPGPGLTGFCFVMRADLPVRFDESYRWWYGDGQFEKDVRAAGYVVGLVRGVPLRHRLHHSSDRDRVTFDPLIEQDRLVYETREGRRPAVPSGIGTSYR
jgi:GT2 family glycosyltransferase